MADSLEKIIADIRELAATQNMVRAAIYNDWADRLAALPKREWLPIAEIPDDGYFIVYEDGAYRMRLRGAGKWMDTAYAGIECEPWGDVAVGDDARRILGPGKKLVVRDGCCDEPTHFRELPPPPTVDESEGES